ncbi:penicillin-binding protein [Lentzea tibetensis]|uniref:Penicillin-binding protein n=1 Tax=Lentzea tibetensis TaxID=2591470 RepID=A0A563EQM7_9PSEU|nr:penicillin-binding transpeptidase domain-containing protein [Lentzea tibetensis]TWP50039.1 penicillin-binding protein [Lentzea tibetensis]
MKKLLGVIGVLALVIGLAVWQRSDDAPPPAVVLKDVVLQYADGSELERIPGSTAHALRLSRVATQVVAELPRTGMTLDQLRSGGATIRTTLDPKAHTVAATTADLTTRGQPETLRTSLTAIDPASGAVKAYWPGKAYKEDYARGILRQAGSTFLPIDLVAALQAGKTLDTTYDGRSPRKIGGQTIRGPQQCSATCTLREALAKSSYPVFYDLVVNDTGTNGVKKAAHQAGVPQSVELDGKKVALLVGEDGSTPNGGIALGADNAELRPFDLAAAYATLASGGVRNEPFFIEKITGADGALLHQAVAKPVSAFHDDHVKSGDIAAQITGALQANPICDGKACQPGAYESPGSADQNSTAWMVGYTPTLAVSVFVGSDDEHTALKDAAGAPIDGTGLPATIWKGFLAGL